MIKHISLGTKEVFYYDYNGEQLPLRPISSLELDNSFNNSLINTSEEIVEILVKFKLSLVKPNTKVDIDNKKYSELKRCYQEIDFWIVYYAMKDFQDEDFSKPKDGIPFGITLVKKMTDIHKIAKEVLGYSYQPKEVIKEIVKDEEGKTIANIVFYLNVPLTDFASMTKLQRDFLILSKIKPKEEHSISKTGDIVDLRKLLGGLV